MPALDGRLVGLAHLSLLDLEPPRVLDLAAAAGFDFVGLRVRAVTDAERPSDLQPGSATLRRTLARMDEHGLTVRDVEFLLLDGSDQQDAWRRMIEAGHRLGASCLTVAVGDRDLSRVAERLALLTEDARPAGIVPALEPISYQAVHSLPTAVRLAEEAGCDVLVDTLHVARFGGGAEELAAAAGQVPLVQVCDAPALAPAGRDLLVEESRVGRAAPGEGALDLAGMIGALQAGRQKAGVGTGPLPVSVEVPDLATRRRLGDAAWARRLYDATVSMLADVGADAAAPTSADAAGTPSPNRPTRREDS